MEWKTSRPSFVGARVLMPVSRNPITTADLIEKQRVAKPIDRVKEASLLHLLTFWNIAFRDRSVEDWRAARLALLSRSALMFAALWVAFRCGLDLIGERTLHLYRRLLLFRFARFAVASNLSFSHWCDPF
jgi:hypothetical protein